MFKGKIFGCNHPELQGQPRANTHKYYYCHFGNSVRGSGQSYSPMRQCGKTQLFSYSDSERLEFQVNCFCFCFVPPHRALNWSRNKKPWIKPFDLRCPNSRWDQVPRRQPLETGLEEKLRENYHVHYCSPKYGQNIISSSLSFCWLSFPPFSCSLFLLYLFCIHISGTCWKLSS